MNSVRTSSRPVDQFENGNAERKQGAHGGRVSKDVFLYASFVLLVFAIGAFLSLLPRLQ